MSNAGHDERLIFYHDVPAEPDPKCLACFTCAQRIPAWTGMTKASDAFL
jgi:hypothetical protein